jgi:DNA modification methylase
MSIQIEKFPVRYDVHKYLGRKPWYIVYDLINNFSKPKSTVLDLFSGSGVVSFEALRLDRNVIAVDHSMLSELIVKSLCEPPNIGEFNKVAHNIINKLNSLQQVYYITTNFGKGILKYWIPSIHKGKALINGKFISIENMTEDIFIYSGEVESFSWEHSDELIPKIQGSNVTVWGDIFTKRSQYVLYKALSYIKKIDNITIKRALLVAFSASLEKIALLNRPKTGMKGWIREKPTCYYKPLDFIEFNAVDAIKNKITKMHDALVETNKLLKNHGGTFKFIREHAENLNYDNKVDLIVMDPPYLNEVPYDKLEALHDIWLDFKPQEGNIQHTFGVIASKCYNALKDNGKLILLMLNYQKESKKFFINELIKHNFVKIDEIEKEGKSKSKEGLSIIIFKKFKDL